MKVMIDNDLPPRLAIALRTIFQADGDEIVALRTKFERQDLKDEECYPNWGAKGGGL